MRLVVVLAMTAYINFQSKSNNPHENFGCLRYTNRQNSCHDEFCSESFVCFTKLFECFAISLA